MRAKSVRWILMCLGRWRMGGLFVFLLGIEGRGGRGGLGECGMLLLLKGRLRWLRLRLKGQMLWLLWLLWLL
ncbi:hypothetical protein BDQ17DRAFT_1376716, partial [Cyathus striatus]